MTQADLRAARSQLLVLVVDAERSLAEGLALRLGYEDLIGATRSATGALEALHLLGQQAPDVLLVGVDRGSWQLRFLRQVMRLHPDVRVVVMSETGACEELPLLVQAGAMGWVAKTASVAELSNVLNAVAAGQWWLPRELLGLVVRQLSREVDGAAAQRLARLTFRERQVLVAMADGLPRSEIAARLRVSVNTVRTHVQHLLAKLEVHTSLEAVTLALREGVAIPDAPHRTSSPVELVGGPAHRPGRRLVGAGHPHRRP